MLSSTNKIKRERLIKLIAVLGLLASSALIILKVDNLLVSFLLAFVISYLVSPAVNALERSGLSRTVAIVIPYVGVAALFSIGIVVLSPILSGQFRSLQMELPKYLGGLTGLLLETQKQLSALLGDFFDIDLVAQFEAPLIHKTTAFFESVPGFLGQTLTILFLAPFFAFFILKDGQHLLRSLFKLVPNNLFELALHLNHQINFQVGGFIRARLLESLLVGGVVWIGLSIISFPYAFLMSSFAALTNLIPYIGPIIGAAPAILIALINGVPFLTFILVVSVYLLAQILDIIFIIPLVVAKIVDLHPVIVVLAIIIGAQVLGVLGMVISIPVAGVLKVTLQATYRHLISFR